MIRQYFSTLGKGKKLACLVLFVALFVSSYIIAANANTNDDELTVWVVCQPNSYINVRQAPSKSAPVCGYLDSCDKIIISTKAKNGFFRILYPAFECEGYVYCGFVSTSEPMPMDGQTYTVVSNARVAARRWMDGPRVSVGGWLINGTEVQVFYMTDEWAVTNRGFVKAEFLEVW